MVKIGTVVNLALIGGVGYIVFKNYDSLKSIGGNLGKLGSSVIRGASGLIGGTTNFLEGTGKALSSPKTIQLSQEEVKILQNDNLSREQKSKQINVYSDPNYAKFKAEMDEYRKQQQKIKTPSRSSSPKGSISKPRETYFKKPSNITLIPKKSTRISSSTLEKRLKITRARQKGL